jgi:hypothetical protein
LVRFILNECLHFYGGVVSSITVILVRGILMVLGVRIGGGVGVGFGNCAFFCGRYDLSYI